MILVARFGGSEDEIQVRIHPLSPSCLGELPPVGWFACCQLSSNFVLPNETTNAREAVFATFRLSAKTCPLPNLSDTHVVPNGVLRAAPAKPFAVVLGGAKVSDKISLIENVLPRADSLLIGGAMAYTFLAAQGKNVGSSKVETDKVGEARRLLEMAANRKCDLHLPVDHICSTQFSENSGDIDVFEGMIKDGFMGLDIGPRTQIDYALTLNKARTIVWNGPMGVFEMRPFKVGTQMVAHAIADATDKGAVSIIGGGDTAAAAEAFGLAGRFSHVSTGGGASLEMLAGRPFTTVELLDNG